MTSHALTWRTGHRAELCVELWTYDGLEWPCRLPVDMRRRVLELGEEEPGGLTKTMRGRWRSRAEGVGVAHTT